MGESGLPSPGGEASSANAGHIARDRPAEFRARERVIAVGNLGIGEGMHGAAVPSDPIQVRTFQRPQGFTREIQLLQTLLHAFSFSKAGIRPGPRIVAVNVMLELKSNLVALPVLALAIVDAWPSHPPEPPSRRRTPPGPRSLQTGSTSP